MRTIDVARGLDASMLAASEGGETVSSFCTVESSFETVVVVLGVET